MVYADVYMHTELNALICVPVQYDLSELPLDIRVDFLENIYRNIDICLHIWIFFHIELPQVINIRC